MRRWRREMKFWLRHMLFVVRWRVTHRRWSGPGFGDTPKPGRTWWDR